MWSQVTSTQVTINGNWWNREKGQLQYHELIHEWTEISSSISMDFYENRLKEGRLLNRKREMISSASTCQAFSIMHWNLSKDIHLLRASCLVKVNRFPLTKYVTSFFPVITTEKSNNGCLFKSRLCWLSMNDLASITISHSIDKRLSKPNETDYLPSGVFIRKSWKWGVIIVIIV